MTCLRSYICQGGNSQPASHTPLCYYCCCFSPSHLASPRACHHRLGPYVVFPPSTTFLRCVFRHVEFLPSYFLLLYFQSSSHTLILILPSISPHTLVPTLQFSLLPHSCFHYFPSSLFILPLFLSSLPPACLKINYLLYRSNICMYCMYPFLYFCLSLSLQGRQHIQF